MAMASLAVLVYLGYRKAQTFAEDMKDPVKRTAKVRHVLGCNRLPDGYHAVMSVSVPYVFDMAVLMDRALEDLDRSGGRKGFVYLSMMSTSMDRADLKAFVEGRVSRSTVLERQRIRIDARKTLRRGSFVGEDATVYYVCQRGGLRIRDQEHEDLVTTLQLIECANDRRLRMGIWFAPDPAPGTEAAAADFAGTPADEEALIAFLGHFRFCR
jgi:hypothetical protein